jgi:hypothetical protein
MSMGGRIGGQGGYEQPPYGGGYPAGPGKGRASFGQPPVQQQPPYGGGFGGYQQPQYGGGYPSGPGKGRAPYGIPSQNAYYDENHIGKLTKEDPYGLIPYKEPVQTPPPASAPPPPQVAPPRPPAPQFDPRHGPWGPGGCPRPEEHIQLANNDWILAGELKVGDKVITSEEPQKVTFAKTIEDSPRREVLFTEGDSIVTSPSHPYFVKDKGFVDVEDLKEGDAVGDLIVSEIKPFSDGPVIHISVDKAQTYMLRGGTEENPVPALSHNKSRRAPPPLIPQRGG